jgi:mono/diheme cytochrome c family protein
LNYLPTFHGRAIRVKPWPPFAPEGRKKRLRFCAFAILYPVLLLTNSQADVTYQETIRPLFQDSCLNCHNPDKQKAGLDLSTYDATMDGSDDGKVVEPGDPDKSVLIKVLTHEQEPYMPKGNDKLPDAQIDLIRQWIQANAPEKTGGAIVKQNSGPAVAVVPAEERPQGPPAMPDNGLLEPVIHTLRRGAVPSVAGSPWAPLVAVAAQKQVLLYNTDSLELAGILPFPEGFPQIVRFSHNGSLLIAGGGIGAKLGHVVIWDVVTGKRVAQIGDEFDTVLAADISPDQSLVALGGPSRLVKIFSAADGHMICKMKKHTDWVTALSFTPDGKELISGDRAGGLSVWDCQGHELQSVSAHAAGITGIACRGNIVATSSEDGTVKFWDIVEGKELKSWHAHNGGVRSVAFTADGHIVTSGRDRLVRLWDVNGAQIKQYSPLDDIAMQATATGGNIIAADWTGVVRLWTQDGKRRGDLESNPPTIEERIDTLSKRLADLQSLLPKTDGARTEAAAALAAARAKAADGVAALNASKAAVGAAQGRLASLRKQAADGSVAVKNLQQQITGFGILARQIACASAANPLLELAIFSTLGAQVSSSQSRDAQNAALGRLQSAIGAAQAQCATLANEANVQARSSAALADAVKSAQKASDAAQTTEARTAAEAKTDKSELIKGQAAAARLASNPQYASEKTEIK